MKNRSFLFAGIFLLSGLPILALMGCEGTPIEYVNRTVVSIGDCTEGTDGWGGLMGRCRVTYDTGEKGTVMRPVDVGDTVKCVAEQKNNEYYCEIL